MLPSHGVWLVYTCAAKLLDFVTKVREDKLYSVSSRPPPSGFLATVYLRSENPDLTFLSSLSQQKKNYLLNSSHVVYTKTLGALWMIQLHFWILVWK